MTLESNLGLAAGGEVAQAELFDASQLPVGHELLSIDEDARRGRFSGAIIERNREKVRSICAALAEGIGILRVARAFGVSPHTVTGIRERNPHLIAIEKKQLSRTYAAILMVGSERYLEAIHAGSINPRDLPIGLGIVSDKKALLDGDATSRVETVQMARPSVESITAWVEAERLKRAKRVESTPEGAPR